MEPRTTTILVIILVLLVVPALCLGAFLEHPCGCDLGSCGHEVGCADDPCNTVVRPEDTGTFVGDLPALEPCPTFLTIELVLRAGKRREIIAPPAPPSSLPYHASDVPLLI